MNAKITAGRIPRLPDDGTPEEFYNFLRQLICKSQMQRLCSKDQKDYRYHPYFDGIDWDELQAGNVNYRCDAVAEFMVCVDEANEIYSPKPPNLDEVQPPALTDLAVCVFMCVA